MKIRMHINEEMLNCTSSVHYNLTLNTLVNHTVCTCSHQEPVHKEVQLEAFFYIVVVIVFYATSIVLLLVKYARNDDEEETLKFQYSEFVKRERFQAPLYKNRVALERTKTVLDLLESGNNLGCNCPTITISQCSDISQDADNEQDYTQHTADITYHVETAADVLDDGTNIVININSDSCSETQLEPSSVLATSDSKHANSNKNGGFHSDKFGRYSRMTSEHSSEIDDHSSGIFSLSYDTGMDYLNEVENSNRCEWEDADETVMYVYGCYDAHYDKYHSI